MFNFIFNQIRLTSRFTKSVRSIRRILIWSKVDLACRHKSLTFSFSWFFCNGKKFSGKFFCVVLRNSYFGRICTRLGVVHFRVFWLFLRLLTTEFAACSMSPSRDNHRKAPYPRTQQRVRRGCMGVERRSHDCDDTNACVIEHSVIEDCGS